ncbi:sensor histidine kinase [Thalassobacillus sp. B23F22_16]|uniref:sensor histidine kinase n=1 Tax=Thalassobacillus sp. B23F22_16 TaxID=3459513 RepID=UPI00373FA9E0
MIRKYIKERRSWIGLFLFLQILLISIAYLDPTIPVKSIGYILFLSLIIFIFFLTFRYQKEAKFYCELEERENNLDITSIVVAESPFEKVIEETLIGQIEVLKKEVAQNEMSIEQEKEELLAWIHEIKTPLSAMHLMLERVNDEELQAQLTYEWLRIHLLLDQQLHSKRIAFMENDLYIEPLDVKEVIFGEIKPLQYWCMQKGIGFDIDLEVKEVLSDGKWLAFIMRQLLSNAVKYSEKSDIIIRSYREDGKPTLSVEDHGRGIEAKDVPRIFEKGFTSTAKHEEQSATGMGLYLAEKAAQALLISIEVHTQPEKGTTFTLTFPKENEFVDVIGM